MKTPLQRIRLGAIVLAITVVMAIVGYRLCGYEWLDAVWMVVITVSSVGFGERSTLDLPAKLLTLGVIVFGMSAAFYTIGGLLQMLTEGELERAR